MALPVKFQERLEQMEQMRHQRLSLLQAEKDLQLNKSHVLALKLSNIRSMEQRCLLLDCTIASKHFTVSTLKSKLDLLDSNYVNILTKYRDLKNEVDGLEKLEEEKDSFYNLESRKMEDFREQEEIFIVEQRVQVEELRSRVNELKSKFAELQMNINYSGNSEIAAAEKRKSELKAVKENLEQELASNRQLRNQLKNQLLSLLAEQNYEKKKICNAAAFTNLEQTQN